MKHDWIKINRFSYSLYIAALVTLAAAFGLYWFLTHSFLTLRIDPKNALVTLNNAPVTVNAAGRAQVTTQPGAYTLRVEADGYIAYLEKIDLKRGRKQNINTALKTVPKPKTIAENARLLSKDKEFNTAYYLGDGGKTIYRATIGNDDAGAVIVKSTTPLTEAKLSGIDEIIWSPNRDLALFRKSNGVYMFDFKRYDFVNQTETLWEQNVGSMAWAPNNSKIAYSLDPGNGEKSLMFSNLAHTEVTRVANLAEMKIENPILRWSPDSEWLLVIPRDKKDYNNNVIYLFNTYSRTFKRITDTGSQVDAVFSPDNNQILYATYLKNGDNPVTTIISVMNKDGSNKRQLNLRAELKKITWQNNSERLTIASYNETKHQESIFGFDMATKQKADFSINALGNGYINTLMMTDDNNSVIYEADNGIYALKVK